MATKVDSDPRIAGDGTAGSLDFVVRRDAQLGFLPDLVALAVKYAKPDRIVLFGSRARGDHTRGSDVDVAFYIPEAGLGGWSRFVAEAEEGLRTLHWPAPQIPRVLLSRSEGSRKNLSDF
jgi:hypothetical protein